VDTSFIRQHLASVALWGLHVVLVVVLFVLGFGALRTRGVNTKIW
jgi:hypothetical protein